MDEVIKSSKENVLRNEIVLGPPMICNLGSGSKVLEPEDLKFGTLLKHKKGGLYLFIGCSNYKWLPTDPKTPLFGMARDSENKETMIAIYEEGGRLYHPDSSKGELVLYIGLNGILWARPANMFFDGRFQYSDEETPRPFVRTNEDEISGKLNQIRNLIDSIDGVLTR